MAKRSTKKKVREEGPREEVHVKKADREGLPDLAGKPGSRRWFLEAHPAAQSLHAGEPFDFVRVMRRPALEAGQASTEQSELAAADSRGALLDTWTSRFYNNASSCADASPYEDGFAGRSGDRVCSAIRTQMAAEPDVAADLRRLPHQVQGRSPAAERSARRHPPAVLAQRGVSAEPRAGKHHLAGHPDACLPSSRDAQEVSGRERRDGRGDHRRGGVAGHRHARLRRGDHCQGERRALARAGRPPAAHRGVRLRAQVQAAGPAREGPACRAFFLALQYAAKGLDRPRGDRQDGGTD